MSPYPYTIWRNSDEGVKIVLLSLWDGERCEAAGFGVSSVSTSFQSTRSEAKSPQRTPGHEPRTHLKKSFLSILSCFILEAAKNE